MKRMLLCFVMMSPIALSAALNFEARAVLDERIDPVWCTMSSKQHGNADKIAVENPVENSVVIRTNTIQDDRALWTIEQSTWQDRPNDDLCRNNQCVFIKNKATNAYLAFQENNRSPVVIRDKNLYTLWVILVKPFNVAEDRERLFVRLINVDRHIRGHWDVFDIGNEYTHLTPFDNDWTAITFWEATEPRRNRPVCVPVQDIGFLTTDFNLMLMQNRFRESWNFAIHSLYDHRYCHIAFMSAQQAIEKYTRRSVYEGDEEAKRQALTIVESFAGTLVYEILRNHHNTVGLKARQRYEAFLQRPEVSALSISFKEEILRQIFDEA